MNFYVDTRFIIPILGLCQENKSREGLMMTYYKSEEDFETKDDLELDVDFAQQDYQSLITITNMLAGVPTRANLQVGHINNEEIKDEAQVLVDEIEVIYNKLLGLRDAARKATERYWEEPENSGEHSTMNKIGTGCRS